MVYSIRSEKPIISTKPIENRRTEGEHARKVRIFMSNHKVSIRADKNGEIKVNITDV